MATRFTPQTYQIPPILNPISHIKKSPYICSQYFQTLLEVSQLMKNQVPLLQRDSFF
jgi:hypothetical protein